MNGIGYVTIFTVRNRPIFYSQKNDELVTRIDAEWVVQVYISY
jgi:hypothetical protein